MSNLELLSIPVRLISWQGEQIGSNHFLVFKEECLELYDAKGLKGSRRDDAKTQIIDYQDIFTVHEETDGTFFKKRIIILGMKRVAWLGQPFGVDEEIDENELLAVAIECRQPESTDKLLNYLEPILIRRYTEEKLVDDLASFAAGVLSLDINECIKHFGGKMQEGGFESMRSQKSCIIRCFKTLVKSGKLDGIIDEDNDRFLSPYAFSGNNSPIESISTQIERLAKLRKEGVITTEEFQAFSKRFQIAPENKAREYIAAIGHLYDQFQQGAMGESNYRNALWGLLDKLDRKT